MNCDPSPTTATAEQLCGGAFHEAEVEDEATCTVADQGGRGFAFDSDGAVIGDVVPGTEGENSFRKEFEVAEEVARRVNRPEVLDPRIRALNENAGSTEATGFNRAEIADRDIVRVCEDPICKIAKRRQVAEVEKFWPKVSVVSASSSMPDVMMLLRLTSGISTSRVAENDLGLHSARFAVCEGAHIAGRDRLSLNAFISSTRWLSRDVEVVLS